MNPWVYPGKSVVPSIHPFPRNYTHYLTRSHGIIPLFSPQDTTKQQARMQAKTHEPTGAHKCTCRPACKNADVQARKHLQEFTHICASLHICTGLHVCAGSTHASTQAHISAHAHMRSHTYRRACQHAETHTLAHLHRRVHTHMLVRVGARTHARSPA